MSELSVTFDFSIECFPGRSLSDDGWEEIYPSHIAHWKSASRILGSQSITCRDYSASLQVDWLPVLRRERHNYGVMKELHDALGTPAAEVISTKFRTGRVRVLVTITAPSRSKINGTFANYIVENFLYDFFLIMNISAPGSCNFFGATIRSEHDIDKDPLRLSELRFDLANLEGREGKWPVPKIIPLDSMPKWYSSVRNGVSQVPQNRMEKVLFALLHIAKLDMSPVTVIWLCYALETIFDTKSGENFRNLFDRIQLLLTPNERQAKTLRKKLSTLYKVRSSFVHGGLEVVHPMLNERLDQNVLDKWDYLDVPSDFGFRMLLCVVQSIIERQWRWPEFKEVLYGCNDAK